MIQDAARSTIPALAYGMPHAVGSTILVIGGMVVVLLKSNLGS